MTASKTASVLSGLTAGVLLASVAVRLGQDAPLFGATGSDPLALALLSVELVVLGIGALLGLAGAYIAFLTWKGVLRRWIFPAITFGLILLAALFIAFNGKAVGLAFGGLLALMSGAALISHVRLRRSPASELTGR